MNGPGQIGGRGIGAGVRVAMRSFFHELFTIFFPGRNGPGGGLVRVAAAEVSALFFGKVSLMA